VPEIKIENKSVFSLVDSAVDTTLPAFAAERRAVAPCCGAVLRHRAAAPLLLGAQRSPLSIDISSPHGAQQQTRRTPLLRSNDGRHGRTKTRPLHRPCSAFCAGSANNVGAGPWPLPLFSFVFRWSEETQI